MQVRNNYDLMWKDRDSLTSGMGVFNGDIGQIPEVDNRNELITVDFEGRIVEYSPDMLGELEPLMPSPSTRPRAASTGR